MPSRWRGSRGLSAGASALAREILSRLEREELSRGGRPSLSGAAPDRQQQLGLFQAPAAQDDPLRQRLRALDVDQLTPLQALMLLAELKSDAGDG